MIMSALEQEILVTLTELDQAVKSMATANPKPNLMPLFGRIDQLARQLPSGTDPTLLHYLHKKSYEKARLWLEGRDADNRLFKIFFLKTDSVEHRAARRAIRTIEDDARISPEMTCCG